MDKAPRLGADGWHARFLQQAGWTRQVRDYLAVELGLANDARILEVGCGTGVITAELGKYGPTQVCGLDISPAFLRKATDCDKQTFFTCADAFRLPYRKRVFTHCVCHFLLLWLAQPLPALKEMIRVTQSGGSIILFAEPDYSARIDYPESLKKLGVLQAQSLASQGADPNIGRSLAHLLVQAGCVDVHSGLMGGQWGSQTGSGFIRSEQDILRADLSGRIPDDELERLLSFDRQAWKDGIRILYVPTFYAWGRVA
ncbi:MAG: class I SAM-dependent methyltransferase [Chloroflexi bacterium]|nr:class I SAM-dependent methyltransferase [Chloroflexota bacterium]